MACASAPLLHNYLLYEVRGEATKKCGQGALYTTELLYSTSDDETAKLFQTPMVVAFWAECLEVCNDCLFVLEHLMAFVCLSFDMPSLFLVRKSSTLAEGGGEKCDTEGCRRMACYFGT